MLRSHPAMALCLVALIINLGACRGEDEVEDEGADETTVPALKVPAMPDFGPLGELVPGDDDGAWSIGAGFGDREEFRVAITQTSRTSLPDRAPMVHQMRQEFTLVREVISRDDDGMTRLRMRIKDASFVPLGPEGKPAPTPPQMASFAPSLERVEVHLAMDARGGVKELDVAKASTLPRGMEDLFQQLVRDLQVTMPPDTARPGRTWDDTGTLPVERAKSQNVLNWRLEGSYRGKVDWKGVQCAMITSEGELEEEGKVERKGILGEVEGQGSVRKVALVEAETGRLVELRMVSALARRVVYGKESRKKARVEELTMELSMKRGSPDEEGK